MHPTKARNVVLVHGLFADGSCWSEVIARLQAAGLNATSVQNPLTTLPEAVASAERVLARQDGPTVLVGHSFSGMIVTEAGVHPNVSALVYVAARAPDAGEDYTALGQDLSDAAGDGRASSSTATKDGSARRHSCAISPATCRKRRRRCSMRSSSRSTRRCSPARPRMRPGDRSRAIYAVSTEDRTINPDLERFMAKRMGAKTIEVKASHLALISHPDEIAGLILEAALVGA